MKIVLKNLKSLVSGGICFWTINRLSGIWYDMIWYTICDIWYVIYYTWYIIRDICDTQYAIWYTIYHTRDMIWYMMWYMIYDTIRYDTIRYDTIRYVIWYDILYDIWYDIHDMTWYMIRYDMIYDMIYLLTAIGLTPGGSRTVHSLWVRGFDLSQTCVSELPFLGAGGY